MLGHVGPSVGDEAEDLVGEALLEPYGHDSFVRDAWLRWAAYQQKGLPVASSLCQSCLHLVNWKSRFIVGLGFGGAG